MLCAWMPMYAEGSQSLLARIAGSRQTTTVQIRPRRVWQAQRCHSIASTKLESLLMSPCHQLVAATQPWQRARQRLTCCSRVQPIRQARTCTALCVHKKPLPRAICNTLAEAARCQFDMPQARLYKYTEQGHHAEALRPASAQSAESAKRTGHMGSRSACGIWGTRRRTGASAAASQSLSHLLRFHRQAKALQVYHACHSLWCHRCGFHRCHATTSQTEHWMPMESSRFQTPAC
mmetsp:Transcript_48058/g.84576  ORF Transcript_48058/g.84576 Transcript_48058/m.84576 type:complete len:234 (+) Transcript_48058:172-873(+)